MERYTTLDGTVRKFSFDTTTNTHTLLGFHTLYLIWLNTPKDLPYKPIGYCGKGELFRDHKVQFMFYAVGRYTDALHLSKSLGKKTIGILYEDGTVGSHTPYVMENDECPE